MNTGIHLTTASNRVLFYNFSGSIEEVCKVSGTRLMGIAKGKDNIYFANHSEVYKLKDPPKKLFKTATKDYFHHIRIRNNILYIIVTGKNCLYSYNISTGKRNEFQVKKGNNHLSSIFIKDGFYYITLVESKGKGGKKGFSSIYVFDSNFEKVDEFDYGWQSHGFCIINGNRYGLCNYWSGQTVEHPKYGGLMVNGDIKLKFKNNEFFKDISVDNKNIYISGGETAKREKRKISDGILYILDKEIYKIKNKIRFNESGDLNGCLLNNYDLAN